MKHPLKQCELSFGRELIHLIHSEGFRYGGETPTGRQFYKHHDGRLIAFKERRFTINGARLFLVERGTYLDQDGKFWEFESTKI